MQEGHNQGETINPGSDPDEDPLVTGNPAVNDFKPEKPLDVQRAEAERINQILMDMGYL